MPKIRVGINGLGRIGRVLIREWFRRKGIEKNENGVEIDIVAFNNPGQIETYAHLLRYDSLHGRFPVSIRHEGSKLFFDHHCLEFYNCSDPKDIPWSDHKVDIVIDATGKFKDKKGLGAHLQGSVKKVIMCAPGKELDNTIVMGINENTYLPSDHHIISNASCTTNCLAPVAKVLHENFGIINGQMVTVHSYTSDQNLLDGSHKDLRRARAAGVSMIPTSTGAAKALGLVMPELKGKFDGYAVRVPTPNVSLVDLSVNLKREASKEEINKAFHEAVKGKYNRVLAITEEELVSTDFLGISQSAIVDASLTNVIGNMVKVVAWYDNEVGFSNRVLDLTQFIGEKF